MKGNNTWEVLECAICGNYHAQPIVSFKGIYYDSTATYTCPYCGNVNYIYSSKCGKMTANRSILQNGKLSDEEISLEEKLAYTE